MDSVCGKYHCALRLCCRTVKGNRRQRHQKYAFEAVIALFSPHHVAFPYVCYAHPSEPSLCPHMCSCNVSYSLRFYSIRKGLVAELHEKLSQRSELELNSKSALRQHDIIQTGLVGTPHLRYISRLANIRSVLLLHVEACLAEPLHACTLSTAVWPPSVCILSVLCGTSFGSVARKDSALPYNCGCRNNDTRKDCRPASLRIH